MGNRLSKREAQILTLIADGHSNKSIARSLCISESTAENHTHHIYEKLGVSNRAQAVAYAFAKGVVSVKKDLIEEE